MGPASTERRAAEADEADGAAQRPNAWIGGEQMERATRWCGREHWWWFECVSVLLRNNKYRIL